MKIVVAGMKKNMLLAVLPAFALAMAAPAQADFHDPTSEAFTVGGIEAAGDHDHATCACPAPETSAQQLSGMRMPRTRFNAPDSGAFGR
ncbi:hypothetical protein ACWGI1_21200 [Streptomyces sp. NPDC054835]